jgi:8-oxo-dGTP pyrophosphatase MutT (NUDIX family)
MKIELVELFTGPWLALKQLSIPEWGVTYVYAHEARCNGKIAAVLPFRRNEDRRMEYLLRREITPAWGLDHALSAVTGGVETGEQPMQTALRELAEETGYEVAYDDLFPLGTCRGTKACDTSYQLFGVDLTNLEPSRLDLGDGSYLEQTASTQWVISVCSSKDPIVSTMALRLHHLHGIS